MNFMTRTIRLFIFLSLAGMIFTACKSKQNVTSIPGANVPAKGVTTTQPTTTTPVTNEPEVTRNETFSAAQGETNIDALSKKYHVIVGSFSKHENARGLRAQLVSEGNSALIVVNEKGMYRVILASYDDYSGARTKIGQVKNRFADAWVLVQK